jgi:hypothetical protein
MADTLSPTMTLRDFENGYWYLVELKNFAQGIGVPAANRLRKDELERAIVRFLRTGDAVVPTQRSLRKTGREGRRARPQPELRIGNYTSNVKRRTSSSSRHVGWRRRLVRSPGCGIA